MPPKRAQIQSWALVSMGIELYDAYMRSVLLIVALSAAVATAEELDRPIDFPSLHGALTYIAKYESPDKDPAPAEALLRQDHLRAAHRRCPDEAK